MRNKKLLYKEEQLDRGISRYLLGRESLSTGFYENHFSEELAIFGYFRKKAFRKVYARILDLKNLNKATTTLKNSEHVV